MDAALWLPDFVNMHINIVKEFAKDQFNKHGELVGFALIFAAKNPRNGERFSVPKPMIFPMNGLDKDTFSQSIKYVARICESGLVVLITESWCLIKKDPFPHEMQSIQNHPEKQECLFITAENMIFHAGSPVGIERRGYMAMIRRDSEGNGTLESWEDQFSDGKGSLVGRFTDFLSVVPNGQS
jgi:hypothetical protein